MSTRPFWELPPRPGTSPAPESLADRRERIRAGARARAAIRVRAACEANARLAAARGLETKSRLADERRWRANHPMPTRTELETLRGMFPDLKRKGKP
jgi:hypothetical protein